MRMRIVRMARLVHRVVNRNGSQLNLILAGPFSDVAQLPVHWIVRVMQVLRMPM